MNVKLWIDDMRPAPDDTWDVATTSQYATKNIYAALYAGMPYREISFDHDLGMDSEHDAWWVADNLERLAYMDDHPRITWHVHSGNPVGKKRITDALNSADKYWAEHEKVKHE